MENTNRMRMVGSVFLALCAFGASGVGPAFRADLEKQPTYLNSPFEMEYKESALKQLITRLVDTSEYLPLDESLRKKCFELLREDIPDTNAEIMKDFEMLRTCVEGDRSADAKDRLINFIKKQKLTADYLSSPDSSRYIKKARDLLYS